jgi:para-aminobenzoate synthetase component 1
VVRAAFTHLEIEKSDRMPAAGRLAEAEMRAAMQPEVRPLAWSGQTERWFRRLASMPGAVWLDSVEWAGGLGRYSFLAADPFGSVTYRDGRCILHGPADWLEPAAAGPGDELQTVADADDRPVLGPQRLRMLRISIATCDPIGLLARLLERYRVARLPGLPPFQAGVVAVFGYELGRTIELLPRAEADELRLPELRANFYDWCLAIDHETAAAWVVATGLPAGSEPARAVAACQRAEQVSQILTASGPRGAAPVGRPGCSASEPVERIDRYPLAGLPHVSSDFSRDGYLRAVERALAYIRAGDIYQVNLSQRLQTRQRLVPVEQYIRLRRANAAPFGAYFDAGEFVLLSSSPERFLQLEDGAVSARPIKGTRPRGQSNEQDATLRRELAESEKDRAENVMIVDLLRNDLGRVCQYRSISVCDPLHIETFRYVHHLVSEVRGRLRPDCSAIDLLRAAFPGGSVTGAPKVRAMEIIAELERTVRGPYCGSLAWLSFSGDMDSSILIRTMVAARGRLEFGVGGAIVADSDPDAEYEETLAKAAGLIAAIG